MDAEVASSSLSPEHSYASGVGGGGDGGRGAHASPVSANIFVDRRVFRGSVIRARAVSSRIAEEREAAALVSSIP